MINMSHSDIYINNGSRVTFNIHPKTMLLPCTVTFCLHSWSTQQCQKLFLTTNYLSHISVNYLIFWGHIALFLKSWYRIWLRLPSPMATEYCSPTWPGYSWTLSTHSASPPQGDTCTRFGLLPLDEATRLQDRRTRSHTLMCLMSNSANNGIHPHTHTWTRTSVSSEDKKWNQWCVNTCDVSWIGLLKGVKWSHGLTSHRVTVSFLLSVFISTLWKGSMS